MRMNRYTILGLTLVLVAAGATTAWAGLSPEEIAKLGTELTPMGAIKAGTGFDN